MKTIALSLVFAFAVSERCISSESILFGRALDERSISFSAVADEKYSSRGTRMKLKIRNRKKKKLVVKLETGRIFYNESNGIQPFVVQRPAIVAMEPEEEKDVWVFARCGNRSAGPPANGAEFNTTAMGKPKMIEMLNMMNDLKIESISFYQNMVWYFTNDHHISAVTGDDFEREKHDLVIHELCRKNSLQVPWYVKKYKPAESGNDLEFSGIPDKIEAKLEVVLTKTSDLQIQLLDQNGNQIRLLETKNLQPSGVHNIPIVIDLNKLSDPRYIVRVTDGNGSVIDSKVIEV